MIRDDDLKIYKTELDTLHNLSENNLKWKEHQKVLIKGQGQENLTLHNQCEIF